MNDIRQIDGGLISGTLADGVCSFKGVPFAAPPVGARRWKPPQPVIPWEEIRQCEAFSSECPQAPYPADSIYRTPPQMQSEDCLYLNLWTAAKPGDRLPVMVWIHGGMLTRGSGANAVCDGAALAKKGVILVTINYRLGPLGYFAHPELTAESPQHASGNYGVLDQIEALKWVQRNIEVFGGDPNCVTIFGESAGAWSVNVLMASPLAKGLFHRAIGESGGVFNRGIYLKEDRDGFPSAEKIGAAFAAAAGADSAKALRALPAGKIIEIFSADPEGKKFIALPNVDGWVLPDEVRKIFAQGQQNDVPVIVGSNANEMTTLVPPAVVPKTLEEYRRRVERRYGNRIKEFDAVYPVKSVEEIAEAYLGSLRDATFTWQMRTWARLAATGRSRAYLYFFTHVPPNPISTQLGAYHAAEIVYVFNNLHWRNSAIQKADYQLADIMSDYWVNFAATGDPNGQGLPEWPPYDPDSEPYLDFADPVQQRNHLLKAQLDFQEKFLLEGMPHT